MKTLIPLRGVVSRLRHNGPESERPLVELEYVKRVVQLTLSCDAGGELEWTTDRDEAETMEWDAAQAGPKQSFGTRATRAKKLIAAKRHRRRKKEKTNRTTNQ